MPAKPRRTASAHSPAKSPAASPTEPLASRLATVVVWVLVLLPPIFYWPPAKDSFRLPKLVLCEALALTAALLLSLLLARVERIDFRKVLAEPVVRATVPLLLVAALGLATSEHRGHVLAALLSLTTALVALAAFSWSFSAERLRRFLDAMLIPAVVVSVIAMLQFHNLWEPLRFAKGEGGGRLGITSYAGNPGDLGAYWALPLLFAQAAVLAGGKRRWWGLAVLGIGLYAVAITQSFTAIAAVIAGTAVFWVLLLPRRRVLQLAGAGLALGVLLFAVVAPLRHRVLDKLGDLKGGQLNRLLTGRLDGWRAAAWMFEQHPLVGVGHGAYRTEFGKARLALVDEGVQFFRSQKTPVFANAHNEYLEVAAEWGLVGLAALGWALWVLVSLLRGKPRSGLDPPSPDSDPASYLKMRQDRALAWAGVTALAVLSLSYFPFRVAMTAYPALIFLAWVFQTFRREEAP